MLKLTHGENGGDIDWIDFVRQHSHFPQLLPQFCAQKYHRTTLSRKWSEVRTKRTAVRKFLQEQLLQQLKNVLDVDAKHILDVFHLSHIVKMKYPNASTRSPWRACPSEYTSRWASAALLGGEEGRRACRGVDEHCQHSKPIIGRDSSTPSAKIRRSARGALHGRGTGRVRKLLLRPSRRLL